MAFRAGPDHELDQINGFAFLSEAYLATDPEFDGHVSVPALWDIERGQIVSNDHRVHDGPYRCGFASSQDNYEREVRDLFAALDQMEERLTGSRYLFGDALTESDIRLWVTLARFDAVYATHFKANLRRIIDYPNIWAYAEDLFQDNAFRSTTDFEQMKRHYYRTHPWLNPSGIVPLGPDLDWDAPSERRSVS